MGVNTVVWAKIIYQFAVSGIHKLFVTWSLILDHPYLEAAFRAAAFHFPSLPYLYRLNTLF